MMINHIKENRKFQIIICVLMGVLMIWGKNYIDREYEKIWEEFDKENRNIEYDLNNSNSVRSI